MTRGISGGIPNMYVAPKRDMTEKTLVREIRDFTAVNPSFRDTSIDRIEFDITEAYATYVRRIYRPNDLEMLEADSKNAKYFPPMMPSELSLQYSFSAERVFPDMEKTAEELKKELEKKKRKYILPQQTDPYVQYAFGISAMHTNIVPPAHIVVGRYPETLGYSDEQLAGPASKEESFYFGIDSRDKSLDLACHKVSFFDSMRNKLAAACLCPYDHDSDPDDNEDDEEAFGNVMLLKDLDDVSLRPLQLPRQDSPIDIGQLGQMLLAHESLQRADDEMDHYDATNDIKLAFAVFRSIKTAMFRQVGIHL